MNNNALEHQIAHAQEFANRNHKFILDNYYQCSRLLYSLYWKIKLHTNYCLIRQRGLVEIAAESNIEMLMMMMMMNHYCNERKKFCYNVELSQRRTTTKKTHINPSLSSSYFQAVPCTILFFLLVFLHP